MINNFNNNGYQLVENFLDQQTIKIISKYMEYKIRRGEWKAEEPPQCGKMEGTKYSYYSDPLIEVILEQSCLFVSEICGKNVFPTYSFTRIYQPGEELKKHIDRPSCEISVTVHVATQGEESKIWMRNLSSDEANFYILKPGDAVIYKGCEVEHWREKLNSNQLNVQFMLHYIDKYGKNSKYKYDNRENLGFSPETRKN